MEQTSHLELIEASVRMHLERNEKLEKMRSKLHVEALKMLHALKSLERDEPSRCANMEQRGLMQLLNYLVVDYFDWYGYTSTLQTFAIESGGKPHPKPREKLQRELGGNIDNIEMPLLLQMLIKETGKDNDKLLDNAKWLHITTLSNELNMPKGRKINSVKAKTSKVLKKPDSNIIAGQRPSK
ncbi:GH18217 [Drosophila grimshawi]|uniref:GH18217 n=1 Tax=Drosophila grimshawi TaxID=7222 RepID=B4JFS4_DROGR|nr:GH18217 [Drosophila grimshawi]